MYMDLKRPLWNIFLCWVFALIVCATSYATEREHAIDTTLRENQLNADVVSISTDFPHLDLTDSLVIKINELLGCQIRKVQCRCKFRHDNQRDIYYASGIGMNMEPDVRSSSDPPLEYNIQFHDLLSVSDANSIYVVGAFALKNLKNGKTVVLPVEFRLSKSPKGDNGDFNVKGTARWLEPVVGDWERAWGFRLDDFRSSEVRKTQG